MERGTQDDAASSSSESVLLFWDGTLRLATTKTHPRKHTLTTEEVIVLLQSVHLTHLSRPPSPPNSFSTKCQWFSLTGSVFVFIEFLPLGCGVRRRAAVATATAATACTLSYSATPAVSPHCVQLNFILQLSATNSQLSFFFFLLFDS